MRTLTVVIFVVSLYCLSFIGQSDVLLDSNLERWNQEIQQSVDNNVFSCPYEYIQTNPAIPPVFNQRNEIFSIHRYYPTSKERREFQALPPTLTKANKEFLTELSSKGYNFSDWGNQTSMRWAIPKNHPGQNRSNCLRASILAATAGPIYPAFYEKFKQIDRVFYLATMQNAYIHPTGLILASCGEFYGEESCENRFMRLMKRKINRCRRFLQKYQVIWSTLFHNPSPLSDKIWKYWVISCSIRSVSMTNQVKIVPVPLEEEVFVLTAFWDSTYHHFIVDSLARLAYHYEFLQRNSHIKLHLRATEEYKLNVSDDELLKAQRMRNQFFQLLGINTSRLISGPVLAKKVYIPRALRCSYAVSNPIEIRRIRDYLLEAARRSLAISFPSLHHVLVPIKETKQTNTLMKKRKKRVQSRIFSQRGLLSSTVSNDESTQFILSPALSEQFMKASSIRWPLNISSQFINAQLQKSSKEGLLRQGYFLVMQRYTAASEGNNTKAREWNDYQFTQLLYQLAETYPNYQIIPISDYNQNRSDYCLACDIFLYSRANALIGAHGSGFTNAMFLPPNSLLVEIVGNVNDLHMPVCGYHGVFAGIFGLHHLIFVYNATGMNRLENYVKNITIDITQFHSFLQRYQHHQLYPEEQIEFHLN